MAFLDEIARSGAKDIYERAALVLDKEDAAEFLVRECQHKDYLLSLLTKILKQEAGDVFWKLYADDILARTRDNAPAFTKYPEYLIIFSVSWC